MRYLLMFDDSAFYELMLSKHNAPHVLKKLTLRNAELNQLRFDSVLKVYVQSTNDDETFKILKRTGDVFEPQTEVSNVKLELRQLNCTKNVERILKFENNLMYIEKLKKSTLNEYIFNTSQFVITKNKVSVISAGAEPKILNFLSPIQSLFILNDFLFLSTTLDHSKSQIICYDLNKSKTEWIMKTDLSIIQFESCIER